MQLRWPKTQGSAGQTRSYGYRIRSLNSGIACSRICAPRYEIFRTACRTETGPINKLRGEKTFSPSSPKAVSPSSFA